MALEKLHGVVALNRLHGASWTHFDPTPGETADEDGAKEDQGTDAYNTEEPKSFPGLYVRDRGDSWGSHLGFGGDGEFRVVH